MKRLKQLGITTIADFDDLVFDEEHADFSPAVLNKKLPRKKVIRRFKDHKEALLYFSYLTVSTESLAKQARVTFPSISVLVVKNTMHYKWPHTPPIETAPHNKIITYFPGTHSHDRDFLQVSAPLEHFLSEHADVKLLVIGPLLSPLLNKQNKQIEHINKLPFTDYSQAARNSWVNLLPLEQTPFNFCKSAIKVIEAGSYLAPTITSPLPDALRFEGIGSLVAIDDNQWLKHLENLYDPTNYKRTTQNIEEHFAIAAAPEKMAIDFYNAFSKI
jgi:hypothetical protein